MGTVATFTLRDLNRQPAKVLAAVRKYGSAEVRTRGGEVFTVAPKQDADAGMPETQEAAPSAEAHFEALWQRMGDMGYKPPVRGEFDEERFNRTIAGEE